MDIAKIRKKAHSKDAGSKPEVGEKPVSGPAEDEKKEVEKEQAAVEVKDAPQEEAPAGEIAAWVIRPVMRTRRASRLLRISLKQMPGNWLNCSPSVFPMKSMPSGSAM